MDKAQIISSDSVQFAEMSRARPGFPPIILMFGIIGGAQAGIVFPAAGIFVDPYGFAAIKASIIWFAVSLIVWLPAGIISGLITTACGLTLWYVASRKQWNSSRSSLGVSLGMIFGATISYVIGCLIFPGLVPFWWLAILTVLLVGLGGYSLSRAFLKVPSQP